MGIVDTAAYEVCKLLWDLKVPVEYFHGENLCGERRTIGGDKVVAIIEPEALFQNMVPHWSITVTHKYIRVDEGGIGTDEANPHKVTQVSLADPKLFQKIVDAVKDLQVQSAGYQLADILLDNELEIDWPYQHSEPGSRTSRMTIKCNKWRLELHGRCVDIAPGRIHGQPVITFDWYTYKADKEAWVKQLVELLKSDPLPPEGGDGDYSCNWAGAMIATVAWDEETDDGKPEFKIIGKRDLTNSESEWEPEEGFTKEDIAEAMVASQAQMDRFHKRRKWTPDTVFEDSDESN